MAGGEIGHPVELARAPPVLDEDVNTRTPRGKRVRQSR